MSSRMETSQMNRLPIKLTIEQCDLDSDDEITLTEKDVAGASGKVAPSGTRGRRVQLSSEIQTGIEDSGVYVDVYPSTLKPGDAPTGSRVPEVEKTLAEPDKLLSNAVIKPGFEKLESVPRYDEKLKKLKKQRRKEAAKTKGAKWYGLPATEMTEEKLRDLEIIQMRSILNPKQFYKKNDLKVIPKYFQVGKVVDQAADFYHSRVTKKDRKKSLVEELMADANFQKYNKRKYSEIIQSKNPAAGASRHSKRLKRRRK